MRCDQAHGSEISIVKLLKPDFVVLLSLAVKIPRSDVNSKRISFAN